MNCGPHSTLGPPVRFELGACTFERVGLVGRIEEVTATSSFVLPYSPFSYRARIVLVGCSRIFWWRICPTRQPGFASVSIFPMGDIRWKWVWEFKFSGPFERARTGDLSMGSSARECNNLTGQRPPRGHTRSESRTHLIHPSHPAQHLDSFLHILWQPIIHSAVQVHEKESEFAVLWWTKDLPSLISSAVQGAPGALEMLGTSQSILLAALTLFSLGQMEVCSCLRPRPRRATAVGAGRRRWRGATWRAPAATAPPASAPTRRWITLHPAIAWNDMRLFCLHVSSFSIKFVPKYVGFDDDDEDWSSKSYHE